MKTELMVETIKHKDVRGKELNYIQIGSHLINVGEKTFNAVEEIIKKNIEAEEAVVKSVSRETEEEIKKPSKHIQK